VSNYSVTEIMNWLRCRQMHQFSSFNTMSLTPIIGKPHFALGTAVHISLATWIEQPEADLNDIYAHVASDAMQQTVAAYERLVGAKPSAAELVPTFEELKLGAAMMKNYQDYYHVPITGKLIAVEQTNTVPIPGTDHNLEFTLDGLITDPVTENMLILEHKTYNSRPQTNKSTGKTTMHRGFQYIAYMWAVLQLNLGRPLGGVAYDGLWKRAVPPRGSTLPDLFHREIITRTPRELEAFEQQLVQIVNEMASDPPVYRTVPWNDCWDCSFVRLCDAKYDGLNYDLILSKNYTKRERTAAYEVLEDA
jgi:hypothetical protein